MIRSRIAALILAALAVVGIGVSAGAASQTQAAWTDQVHVSATATAGTWSTGHGTCTWRNAATGDEIEGCTIVGLAYRHSWGNHGARYVQYDLVTSSGPGVAHYVTFELDLTTADGTPDPDSFDWKGSVLTQLTSAAPSAGWSCTQLPILRGVGGVWQMQFSITVAERGANSNNICGS